MHRIPSFSGLARFAGAGATALLLALSATDAQAQNFGTTAVNGGLFISSGNLAGYSMNDRVIGASTRAGWYTANNRVALQRTLDNGANWLDILAVSAAGVLGVNPAGLGPADQVSLTVQGRLKSNSVSGGVWLGNAENALVGMNGPDQLGFYAYGNANAATGWNGSGWPLLINRNTGQVAIGVENAGKPTPKFAAGYALSVNGTIATEEVRVQVRTAWPDYVFAPSYALKPLGEVAAYLHANRHLPDVPSAAEVTKHGYELGSMDAVLLRKIEELTLYILKQEQQLQQLRAEAVAPGKSSSTEGRLAALEAEIEQLRRTVSAGK